MTAKSKTQYVMAVLLITSSIALAFYQVLDIDDVAKGTLMYIAQAFLLAGSIFGLDYYILKLNRFIHEQSKKDTPEGNPEQQPTQHTDRQQLAGGASASGL